MPVKITNLYSDQVVHKLRAEHEAILIGGHTAIYDDPKLNVRLWNGRSPMRIIIDERGNLPSHINLLDQSIKTFVFNFEKNSQNDNIDHIKIEPEDQPQQIADYLYSQYISSLLIEGGTKTINKFIKANLWDEMKVFISDKNLIEGITAPLMHGKIISSEAIFNDRLITSLNDK